MNHLTNLSSNALDPQKPSLFEIVAEQELRNLLSPTLRYTLAYYAQRHPRYLIHVLNWFDESFALLLLAIDSHFVSTWKGSFTQNLYGIKQQRAPTLRLSALQSRSPDVVSKQLRLHRTDLIKSLLLLVGIPYMREKARFWFEQSKRPTRQTRQRPHLDPSNRTTKQRVKEALLQAFANLYPYSHAIEGFLNICLEIAYMFNKSEYHSIWHFLLGLRLRRMDEYDMILEKQRSSKASPSNRGNRSKLVRLVLMALDSVRYVIPLSIALLRLLEWWNASGFSKTLTAKSSSLVQVPPPKPVPSRLELSPDSNKCTLCKKDITNPAALETGYIFCYPCIYRWLQKHQICPISGTVLLHGQAGLRRLRV